MDYCAPKAGNDLQEFGRKFSRLDGEGERVPGGIL
jgi:hypothetical protein